VRARRRELEAQRAAGTTPVGEEPPPGHEPPPASGEPAAAPAARPVADLKALDEELSRRRADTPPH
jgi:hypothetical protein